MVHHRILIITFPAQGHINPSVQFAKRLIQLGVDVTLATNLSVHRRMTKAASAVPDSLNFVTFSDGYDDGFKPTYDTQHFISELRSSGSQCLREIVVASRDEGRPITCIVYTTLLPWAALVARELHVHSALLWIQPAAVLDIFHSYFNGYDDAIREICNDSSLTIKLPGVPPLSKYDLPSFLLPSGGNLALPVFKEHLEILDGETNPKVLVNTFDELEPEALKAIDKFKFIGVGPLIPPAFLEKKDPLDTSFGCHLFKPSNEYTEWLDSKPESSVVYISFGSMLVLTKQKMEEIARGVLESGQPFLWVMRAKESGEEGEDDKLSCMEELEERGMIVPWCSQVEVLSHPSLGCFVTHCGWSSTLESFACGAPVVAFPQRVDQCTNAKLIEDVWKTGMRVRENEEGIVEGDEIKRCIEIVMDGGEKGDEMKKNAMKWKEFVREALREGGSSDKNLRAFVHEVGDED